MLLGNLYPDLPSGWEEPFRTYGALRTCIRLERETSTSMSTPDRAPVHPSSPGAVLNAPGLLGPTRRQPGCGAEEREAAPWCPT